MADGFDVKRYSGVARKVRITTSRTPWRSAQKKKKPRTPSDAEVILRRRTAWTDYGNKLHAARQEIWKLAETIHQDFPQYPVRRIHEALIQYAKKERKEREPSKWNAFVRKRVKELNSGVTDGVKPKANKHSGQLKIEWDSMTEDEKTAASAESLKELKEMREMKAYAPQQTSHSTFQDMSANLKQITTELAKLHNRTGVEFALVAVRKSHDQYMRPMTFTSSATVNDFFLGSYKRDLEDFALKLEAWCLSGAEGFAKSIMSDITALRHKAAITINASLDDVLRPDKVGRINYQNFFAAITMRHGVVVEGWPLARFCSPGDISSRLELETLIHAWTSGTARFVKLTPADFEARQREYQQAQEQPTADQPDAPSDTGDQQGLTPSTPTPPTPSTSTLTLTAPVSQAATADKGTAPAVASALTSDHAASAVGEKRPAVFSDFRIDGAPKKARKVRSDKGKTRGPRKATGRS